jgi:hypothetical protein
MSRSPRRLAAEGLSPEETSEGLLLRSRTLPDELLVRIGRVLAPVAPDALHIEQAPMNEVFRRLILEAQEARAQEAA